jgi:hypothetical protein
MESNRSGDHPLYDTQDSGSGTAEYQSNQHIWKNVLLEWGYLDIPKSLWQLPASSPGVLRKKSRGSNPRKKPAPTPRPPLLEAVTYLLFLRDYEQWVVKETNLVRNQNWFFCNHPPMAAESADRQARVLDWLVEQGYVWRRKGQQLMHIQMTAEERKRSWLKLNYAAIWRALPRNPQKQTGNARMATSTVSGNGADCCMAAAMQLMRILKRTATPPTRSEPESVTAREIEKLWNFWTTESVSREEAWQRITRLLQAFASNPKKANLPHINSGRQFREHAGWIERILLEPPDKKKHGREDVLEF